jgi:hypothetical protein
MSEPIYANETKEEREERIKKLKAKTSKIRLKIAARWAGDNNNPNRDLSDPNWISREGARAESQARRERSYSYSRPLPKREPSSMSREQKNRVPPRNQKEQPHPRLKKTVTNSYDLVGAYPNTVSNNPVVPLKSEQPAHDPAGIHVLKTKGFVDNKESHLIGDTDFVQGDLRNIDPDSSTGIEYPLTRRFKRNTGIFNQRDYTPSESYP